MAQYSLSSCSWTYADQVAASRLCALVRARVTQLLFLHVSCFPRTDFVGNRCSFSFLTWLSEKHSSIHICCPTRRLFLPLSAPLKSPYRSTPPPTHLVAPTTPPLIQPTIERGALQGQQRRLPLVWLTHWNTTVFQWRRMGSCHSYLSLSHCRCPPLPVGSSGIGAVIEAVFPLSTLTCAATDPLCKPGSEA